MNNIDTNDNPVANIGCVAIATPGYGLDNIGIHGPCTYVPTLTYFGQLDSAADRSLAHRSKNLSEVTTQIPIY